MWRGHLEPVADARVIDQVHRAAAARGIALDGDDIARTLGRIVAERVLAHEPMGRAHLHVGARSEGGELGARGVAQLEGEDLVCRLERFGDDELGHHGGGKD